MNKTALVIMAAGMASRYGGNKQVDGMGPNGEILMEYSIRDAIRAGFTKVVFIIKPEMEAKMREICADKYEKQIDVRYAFQEFASVPGNVPEERVKPFGTVHAVLCAKDCVQEPFAVINADDYYGMEAFQKMYRFLRELDEDDRAAMMGYKLMNTVSLHGTVTRGICQVEGSELKNVREIKKVQLFEDGCIADVTDGEKRVLDGESPVSMNFWGFGKSVFEKLEREFRRFLSEIEEDDLTAEYLLPVFVDEQLKKGEMKVTVIPTGSLWFGVTYKEDRPAVVEILKEFHEQGLY